MKKSMSLNIKSFNKTEKRITSEKLEKLLEVYRFELGQIELTYTVQKRLPFTTYSHIRSKLLKKIKAVELILFDVTLR